MADEELLKDRRAEDKELTEIINGLISNDMKECVKAAQRGQIFFNKKRENENTVILDHLIKEKKDRTHINLKAINEWDCKRTKQESISAEDITEKDITKLKAKDKKLRQEAANLFKRQAIIAFRREEYNIALTLLDKAIKELKDSDVLYTNRALTYIRLRLYFKAIEDCDTALFLNSSSLKARVYKARALYMTGSRAQSEEMLDEACKKYPEEVEHISELRDLWMTEDSYEAPLSTTNFIPLPSPPPS